MPDRSCGYRTKKPDKVILIPSSTSSQKEEEIVMKNFTSFQFGEIQSSIRPFNTVVVISQKKDKNRACSDFCEFNKDVTNYQFHQPQIRALLQEHTGVTFFRSGFKKVCHWLLITGVAGDCWPSVQIQHSMNGGAFHLRLRWTNGFEEQNPKRYGSFDWGIMIVSMFLTKQNKILRNQHLSDSSMKPDRTADDNCVKIEGISKAI